MGVWIEISAKYALNFSFIVTPLVGVWIEIITKTETGYQLVVTPLVGVWIEIPSELLQKYRETCHSPCGSVD